MQRIPLSNPIPREIWCVPEYNAEARAYAKEKDVVRPTIANARGDDQITPPNQSLSFLTTEDVAALWTDRIQEVESYRREHPDDIRGIELRQDQASAAWQAYRLLSMLEHQLGYQLALPVLGPLATNSPSAE